jgi:hypothetical protein
MLEEFRVSVEIKGDIQSIWNRLVDWKSQGDWMAMTKVWSSADDNGVSGVGTVIEAFTGIGKLGILDQMKVTEWNPPYFCAVDHYGKFIKGLGEFRLIEVAPGRIRFDWYEKIDAPKPILLLIKPGILIAVTYSLRKFARSCTA